MAIDLVSAYRSAAFLGAPGKPAGPAPSRGITSGLEASPQVKPKTAYQELDEYVKMTPAQRMRVDMLKKLGLSEDDLAGMPPEQRQGVETRLREMIQQQMQEAAKDQFAPRQVGQWIDTTA